MPYHTLKIEIELVGPFLTQSSSIGSYGVDSPLARTSGNRAYLPFSLLKGKLLQAWEELGAAGPRAWLGAERGNRQKAGSVLADPSRLHLDDLLLDGKAPHDLRHRICIDRERGSVKDGALQVMESPFAAGEVIRFKGQARFFGSRDEAQEARQWVEWGLRWAGSLGAERTNGFGRVRAVTVALALAPAGPAAVAAHPGVQAGGFSFALRPEKAFCLAGRRLAENLFESEQEIPGGVLKGTVARMLLMEASQPGGGEVTAALSQALPAYGLLAKHFSLIRFTHALPAKKGQGVRPARPPLSIVKDSGGAFHDVAGKRQAELIGGSAPQFDIDWKGRGDLDARFGWPEVAGELRVRTAIDPASKRASDEKLFAYQMVNPDGLEWLGSADLTRVPETDRAATANELAALLRRGLTGLGKTKAAIEVEVGPHQPRLPSRYAASTAGEWYVTLVTPALLGDPAHLTQGTGGAGQLLARYRAAWAELSGKVWLDRFYARQSLAGGEYLFRRFGSGGLYRPWLLTNAGSVFVLKAAEGASAQEVGEVLRRWEERGLDTPGQTWRTCPYIAENGYGEIAVNMNTEEALHAV